MDSGNNPGQEDFDKKVGQHFGAGNEQAAASDNTKPKEGLTAHDLADSEKNGGEAGGSGRGQSFYKHDDSAKLGRGLMNMKPSFRGALGFARQNRGKFILGGAAAGIVTLVIVAFLVLIPFKILHIVNNLENRFFASSQNALQNETDALFKQYVKKYVMPAYTKCGTTVSRKCSVKVTGKDPVSNLYRGWANARLENKLAENYGIEFQKRADGWYMKTPNTTGNGINVGEKGAGLDSAFEKVGISDIRTAVKNETQWYQVYLRFKVGSLLQEKYGIRRCLIFCSLTDPLANKVAEQKIAAKLFLTQRVLLPRNQTLGIALECLLSGCKDEQTKPTDEATPGETGALGGAPENTGKFGDKAIRDGLTQLAAGYNVTDEAALNAILDVYTEMSEKGFQNYLVKTALSGVIGKAAAGQIADKIPYAGWINMLSQFVNAANHASGSLKKLSYITNATAAVALFSMYRTYADEVKTGHANATEVGSLTSSLNSGNSGSASDPEAGGNIGAEGAPLYNQLIDGDSGDTAVASETSSKSVSLLNSLFSTTALADSADTSSSGTNYSYKCDDGQPVPAGQPVCPEEALGGGNHYANVIHEYLNNNPFGKTIVGIADVWNSTIGKLFQAVSNILSPAFKAIQYGLDKECSAASFIPGGKSINPNQAYCSAKSELKKLAPQVVEAITSKLIPNPFSSNMSGARTFDMMAAGADVAGNDSAHTTLGGEQLTDQQAVTIVNQQDNEAFQEYKNQPLLARLFDTNSNYSPVTKLALALPNSWSSAGQTIASIFSDPLGKIGHDFGLVFSAGRALAAAPAQPDPFGVVQYGYPSNDPGLMAAESDPIAYWQQHCSDNAAYAYRKDNSWNESASQTLDSNNMPENTATNPCLLIVASTGSDGGLFDSSLLTADDLANNGEAIPSGALGASTP